MNILLLLPDDSVPIDLVEFVFREIAWDQIQIQCLIPHIQQLPFDQFLDSKQRYPPGFT